MAIYNPYITEPYRDNKLGSDCSGTSGAKNRTLTLSKSFPLTVTGVFVNGTFLHEGAGKDFTFATNIVTFLNEVDNSDNILVLFYTR